MENLSYLNDPYSFFIGFVVENVFDNYQRQEFKKISDSSSHCFSLVKQNILDEAKKYFEESVFLFESCQNKHWISTLCMPNISYYEYKIVGYEPAICRTNEIINSLKYLQRNNYQYLFFSEIQQYHNLGRIYFSMDKVALAIDQCIYCLSSIIEHSKNFQSNNFIYEVTEFELYRINQYKMTIQVLAETCNRLIVYYEGDLQQLKKCLEDFVRPLSILDFTSILPGPQYMAIDKFIEIMADVFTNDHNKLHENILLFAQNQYADKALLKTLFKYVNYINSTATAA